MDATILDPTKDISIESLPLKTFDEKSKEALEFFAGRKKNLLTPIYDATTDHVGVLDYGLFFSPTLFLFASYGIVKGIKEIYTNDKVSNTMKIVFGCTLLLPAVALMAACFAAFLILTALKYVMAGVLTFLSLPIIAAVHHYHKPGQSNQSKKAPPVPARPHHATSTERAYGSNQSQSAPVSTSAPAQNQQRSETQPSTIFGQKVQDARRAMQNRGELLGEGVENFAVRAKQTRDGLINLADTAERGGRALNSVMNILGGGD